MQPIPSGRQALQQQRAVLAELFRQGERAISDHGDARVCRFYLAGLCPAELFPNTKFALPPCLKIHDDALRRQYEAALAKGGPSYDGELLFQLEEIVARMERRTLMDARRAEEDEGGGCVIPRVETELTPEVEAADREVREKERALEGVLASGSILAATALEEALEALRRRKCLAQARACREPPPPPPPGRSTHPRLRICSGCGVHLNLQDADDRTADHFQGRAHLGHVAAATVCARLRAAKLAKQGLAMGAGGAAGAGGGAAGPAGAGAAPGAAGGGAAAAAAPPAPAGAAAPSSSGGGGGGGGSEANR
jgi:hypothetical protein